MYRNRNRVISAYICEILGLNLLYKPSSIYNLLFVFTYLFGAIDNSFKKKKIQLLPFV